MEDPRPSSAPRLTEFEEPALPVWVEKGVCQVVAVVLGDFEGLVFNTFIEVLEKESRRERERGVS